MLKRSTVPEDDQTLASLLESLAFVAVEHEDALDLARFTSLVDLYAHHVAANGVDVPFETFVADADRLDAAARAAERATGVPTVAPAPLGTADVGSDAAAPETACGDPGADAVRLQVVA